jgi:hypothetical protein
MRKATTISAIGAAATALAALAAIGAGTASGQSPRTCTWGGTPVAPSGQNRVIGGGLTGTPSTQPLRFHAVGPLGGQCSGTMAFDGVMDAGASCGYITFHARVTGVPGVRTVAGTNAAGFSPARLYDGHGNIVGSENANFLSDPSIVTKCNSTEGVTQNPFSSVVELLGGA